MENFHWFEANQDIQANVLAVQLPDTPKKPPTKKCDSGENAEILEAKFLP